MSSRAKVLALTAVLVFLFAAGYSSAQNPTLETAMRTTLLNAQPLLEAVVTADFTAIGRSADALNRISETEIASWQANAQPDYGSAALTEYTKLVSSCTRCHAHVRRSRVVSFDAPPFRAASQES